MRKEPEQTATNVHSLRWLFDNVPDHAVTRYVRSLTRDPKGVANTPSPASHADALPFMYLFAAEPGTYRCTYMGSEVEQYLGMSAAVGKTLDDIVPRGRVQERYDGLKAIHRGGFALVATNTIIGPHGGHVHAAFVGLPLRAEHASDVMCFLVPWRED